MEEDLFGLTPEEFDEIYHTAQLLGDIPNANFAEIQQLPVFSNPDLGQPRAIPSPGPSSYTLAGSNPTTPKRRQALYCSSPLSPSSPNSPRTPQALKRFTNLF